MTRFIVFLMLFALAGCSGKLPVRKFLSAEDEAVLELLKDIKRDPQDKSLLEMLPEIYQRSMDSRNSMQGYVLRDNPPGERWVYWRKQLEASQSITDAVLARPLTSAVIKNPVHYWEAIADASQKAAAEFYEIGLNYLNYNNRPYAEKALTALRKANAEVAGYRDVQQLIRQAEAMATIVVVVNPVDYNNYGWNHWGLQNDYLQYQMLRDLNNRSYRNIRFFDDREVRSRNLRPERVVDMRFIRLMVSNPYTERNTYQRSKEITETPPPGRPGSGGAVTKPMPIVKTVYANVTVMRRYINGDGDLECRIYDVPTGRNILYDRFPGRYNWVFESASYTGDSRALTAEDVRLINNRFTQYPTREDVALKVIEDSYGRLLSRIQQGVSFDTY